MQAPKIQKFSIPPKDNQLQQSCRLPWAGENPSDASSVLQPKNLHQQPLRFFGSSSHLWVPDGTHPRKQTGKVETVDWENTFNMRAYNLNQFNAPNNGCRNTYRSQAVALQRTRLGFVSGSVKSLDLLRATLQRSINRDIDDVLQKYVQKFFQHAVKNIKLNNGENSVSDQHMQLVCQNMLEEAKKMYQQPRCSESALSSAAPDGACSAISDSKPVKMAPKAMVRKRRDSDTDSEVSLAFHKPRKRKKGRPPMHHMGNASGRIPLRLKMEQLRREGPKWDPARLTLNAEFIMGAKANKALGLGATRGRLYIKHPDIFKYSGDQEDKQWLHDHNLMPATGGKAYLLLVEDIRELAESEEYRDNPALMMHEIVGFTITENMLQKMRICMQQLRADAPVRKRGRPPFSNADLNDSSNRLLDIQTGLLTDELDPGSSDVPSRDRSPCGLSTGFDDIGAAQVDISPAPSDESSIQEPLIVTTFHISVPH